MKQLASFKLDGLPPSANRIWRSFGGHVVRSSEYRKWLDATAWAIRQEAGPGMIRGGYALHVQFVRQSRRKSDIDNLIKPLSDAIVKAGLVEDDHKCQRLKAEWVLEGPAVRAWVIATTGNDDD